MALQFRISGGAGNNNLDKSIGGVMSTVQITDASPNNLLDKILRKEILVPTVNYRLFYILNNGSLPVHGATVYLDQLPVATTIEFGLDPAGTGDGINTGVAQTIADEKTSPSGVTFESTDLNGLRLPIPTLKVNEAIGIWIKRTTEKTNPQTFTVGISVDGNEEALPVGPGTEDFHGTDGVSIGERWGILDLGQAKIDEARIDLAEIV